MFRGKKVNSEKKNFEEYGKLRRDVQCQTGLRYYEFLDIERETEGRTQPNISLSYFVL